MSATPGTERQDCDEADERGVSPGTTSSGRHDAAWSVSAAGLVLPRSHTALCPPLPLNSPDMMIIGDCVPGRRAIGVATKLARLVVQRQHPSASVTCSRHSVAATSYRCVLYYTYYPSLRLIIVITLRSACAFMPTSQRRSHCLVLSITTAIGSYQYAIRTFNLLTASDLKQCFDQFILVSVRLDIK